MCGLPLYLIKHILNLQFRPIHLVAWKVRSERTLRRIGDENFIVYDGDEHHYQRVCRLLVFLRVRQNGYIRHDGVFTFSTPGFAISSASASPCWEHLCLPIFNTCSLLTKTEALLPAGSGESEDYYILREWEMNEDGRLYMCKMMEALNHTALYRVDLYPVEKSVALRDSLRKPMNILRKRQDDRSGNSKRDYDGKDVLASYEDLIEKYNSSPHFIANVLVLANGKEDAVSILDAAGSESLFITLPLFRQTLIHCVSWRASLMVWKTCAREWL